LDITEKCHIAEKKKRRGKIDIWGESKGTASNRGEAKKLKKFIATEGPGEDNSTCILQRKIGKDDAVQGSAVHSSPTRCGLGNDRNSKLERRGDEASKKKESEGGMKALRPLAT